MSVGIKETNEALIGVNECGLHIATKLRDGFQPLPDFAAFWADLQNDADFKAKVQAAWDNHQAIPEEVADIDLGEGVQLVVTQASYVPKLIAALVG